MGRLLEWMATKLMEHACEERQFQTANSLLNHAGRACPLPVVSPHQGLRWREPTTGGEPSKLEADLQRC